MSFYQTVLKSMSGYAAIERSNSKLTELDGVCFTSHTDHRSLGQVVVLPENEHNCPIDYLSSDELHSRALEARKEIKELSKF